jgi:pyruvate ferredoxin oxidoreductase gamma subunit
VNSTRSLDQLGIGEFLAKLPPGHAIALPATDLALRHIGRPLPNAILLAGLCSVTGVLKLESIEKAIQQKFKGKIAEQNIAAAREAAAWCSARITEGAAAHA